MYYAVVLQIGDAGWELFCLDRGIRPDGQMPSGRNHAFDFYDPIFSEHSTCKYVPRAAIVINPTAIEEVRCSNALQHVHTIMPDIA